jgi:hypothetical protein
MTGGGPFGICIGLGNETVVELYDNCVYDMCYNANRCTILAAFAQLCQSNLPCECFIESLYDIRAIVDQGGHPRIKNRKKFSSFHPG